MDYHILDKSINNKTINCVFHIAIPDADNSVGTNWRTALVNHFFPVPVMPWNDPTENTAIENGEIWEVRKRVKFSSISLTAAERVAEIVTVYNAEQSGALTKLSKMLDFYGFGGNI